MDRAAQAAHESSHLTADRKLSAGTRIDDAYTFNPAYLGCFRPLAPTHVYLGMIDPECLHLNNYVTFFRLRLGDFFDHQTVKPAEVVDNNCFHLLPLFCVAYEIADRAAERIVSTTSAGAVNSGV